MIWAVGEYDSVEIDVPVARRNSWVAASGRGVTYVNVKKDHMHVLRSTGRYRLTVATLAFARHRPGNVSLESEHPDDCLHCLPV